jgi:MFS family permease
VSTLTRGFAALRHPNYRLYFFGQLISLIGTWMQTVAQSWLMLQLTGSAVALGIVNALQMLPVLLVGMFGGVFADRVPKRRLLVITQTVQMLLALILAVLVTTGTVQVWHVYVLATGLGLANAFDMPTRQAFVVEMVGRDDLMNAVALNSMQFNAARIVGPALAGVSIAALGVAGSFYANALSFLAVIGGLLLMRTDRFFAVEAPRREPVFKSMAEGCRYVLRTPTVMLITFMVGALGLFAFNSNVLIPLFASDVLHVGAQGYGLLMAAMGAGSLGAALVAAFVQRSRWEMIVGGAIGFCLFELVFAFSHVYWLSIALLGLAGFALISFFTSANTGIQQNVPDRLRGRVMGAYMTVNMGVTPIGNLATGAMAAAFGAPAAMAIGAAAGLVSVLGGSAWLYANRGRSDLSLTLPSELEIELPSARARRERAIVA